MVSSTTGRKRRQPSYWVQFGRRLAETWPLLFCGIGIGWLVGLSISPVTSGVVMVLLSLAAAVTAVLSGFRPASGPAAQSSASTGLTALLLGMRVRGPHAVGVTLLIAGVCLGSAGGIWTRTQGLLGPASASSVPEGDQEGRRPETVGAANEWQERVRVPGLYNNPSPRDVDRLRGATQATVVRMAAQCEDEKVRRFAEVFKDQPETLLTIVKEIIR
jgi:hypothetical protein